MLETQKRMCNKIRAVKNWLNRAEENFSSQNNVQGEINLLLAQAEMQHLKEKKKTTFKKYIFANLAILFFLTLVFWFAQDNQDIQTSEIKKNEHLEQKSDIIDKIERNKNQTIIVNVPQNIAVPKEKSEELVQVKVENTDKKATNTIITDSQKYDLVRVAGKVLRSNN